MAASNWLSRQGQRVNETNNLDLSKGPVETRAREKTGFQEDNKFESLNFNTLNLDSKVIESVTKSSFRNGIYNMNAVFKTLPSTETLPRNEVLGGYIFVCNNDTMQEDLKRQLFDNILQDIFHFRFEFILLFATSIQRFCFGAITPGLPLFLYNYTTHQLHGILRQRVLGDLTLIQLHGKIKNVKANRGKDLCKETLQALEEDAFRPVCITMMVPSFVSSSLFQRKKEDVASCVRRVAKYSYSGVLQNC
ncbi:hypothetical protein HHK36_032584 [Tetracentron sinense]|uniref:DCD domain-containing protein n=1 Tax=Tetracentron sinense TaxID=13715 RepID=A0A834Y7W3_TETSI|nr:hypothetical protein HHK36_032584 [Tetracentron sinense]